MCEDQKNPVVNELLSLYPLAIYNKNTLEQDIRVILGASKIIYSVGSFVTSLLLFSSNITNIYTHINIGQQLWPKCLLNKLILRKIPDEYYDIMRPWKNTIEQRACIVNFKF